MASKINTKLAIALATVGALCLIAAAVLAWIVLPSQARLPADTDVTRQFEGTANLLLNPAALASGELAKVLLRDVPVTADRTVKTVATDGDTAQVSDVRTLRAGGADLGHSEATYAVDRTSLEAAGDHPNGWNVVDHHGLTVSWPIGTEKKDYLGWVGDTHTTTPLRYARTEKRDGVGTYVFEANVAAAPIKDEQVLGALPKSLSPQVLGQLATVLPVPAELKAQLAQVVPRLTADVPLTYTYESTSTYWIEPATGVVVDVEGTDIRKVGLELPGRSVPPSIVVYNVTTALTDASVGEAADEATDGRNAIRLFGTTLPMFLLVVGLLALLPAVVKAAAVVGTRQRTPAEPAQSVESGVGR